MFKNVQFRTAIVVALAALFLVNAGCIGPFKVTSDLYEWNKKIEGKWGQELVFLGFVILPVYSITLFVDGLVLNSIKFWSDDGSTALNEKTIEDGPYVVRLERSETPEGRTLRVRVYEGETLLQEQLLVAQPDGTIVKRDAEGRLLVWGEIQEDGRVVVHDAVRELTLVDVPGSEVPAIVN